MNSWVIQQYQIMLSRFRNTNQMQFFIFCTIFVASFSMKDYDQTQQQLFGNMDNIYLKIFTRISNHERKVKLNLFAQQIFHNHKSHEQISSIQVQGELYDTLLNAIASQIVFQGDNNSGQVQQHQQQDSTRPKLTFVEKNNIKSLRKIVYPFKNESYSIHLTNDQKQLINSINMIICYMRRQDGHSFLIQIHPFSTIKLVKDIARSLFNAKDNQIITILINGRQFQENQLVHPFLHQKGIINCVFYVPIAQTVTFTVKQPNSSETFVMENVLKETSIMQLKQSIANHFNINSNDLYLSYGSLLLDQSKTIESYGIPQGSSIYAINKNKWRKKSQTQQCQGSGQKLSIKPGENSVGKELLNQNQSQNKQMKITLQNIDKCSMESKSSASGNYFQSFTEDLEKFKGLKITKTEQYPEDVNNIIQQNALLTTFNEFISPSKIQAGQSQKKQNPVETIKIKVTYGDLYYAYELHPTQTIEMISIRLKNTIKGNLDFELFLNGRLLSLDELIRDIDCKGIIEARPLLL